MSNKPCQYILKIDDVWLNICKNKNCTFAHSKSQFIPDKCLYISCLYGEKCPFMHDESIESYMKRNYIQLPETDVEVNQDFYIELSKIIDNQKFYKAIKHRFEIKPIWNIDLQDFPDITTFIADMPDYRGYYRYLCPDNLLYIYILGKNRVVRYIGVNDDRFIMIKTVLTPDIYSRETITDLPAYF